MRKCKGEEDGRKIAAYNRNSTGELLKNVEKIQRNAGTLNINQIWETSLTDNIQEIDRGSSNNIKRFIVNE